MNCEFVTKFVMRSVWHWISIIFEGESICHWTKVIVLWDSFFLKVTYWICVSKFVMKFSWYWTSLYLSIFDDKSVCFIWYLKIFRFMWANLLWSLFSIGQSYFIVKRSDLCKLMTLMVSAYKFVKVLTLWIVNLWPNLLLGMLDIG